MLAAYRSTGGILSVWIDLCEDYAANPANELDLEWITPVLVVTERDGEYRDLWGGTWALNPTPGRKGRPRRY